MPKLLDIGRDAMGHLVMLDGHGDELLPGAEPVFVEGGANSRGEMLGDGMDDEERKIMFGDPTAPKPQGIIHHK